ncbi:hypothetical protein OWV82_000051 [Melia azedarach]|uniref:Uncharacterized protein n=1 Tax=Melia azedarach TaxID=155640 RepID=A0ACC1YTS1_MELAZ|nr:hypothetical protein OWV82_000051 [Melia azedarach]
MRQRELVEFRTPQHPFLGTNNWGGASPLLARNIPKESLERRYLKLNTIRTRDEIIPAEDDEFNYLSCNHVSMSKHEPAAPTPSRKSTRGFFLKIIPLRKEKAAAQGTNLKKKRWFPRWDPHHRWPQGWC